MKKTLVILSVISMTVFLSACGSNDHNTSMDHANMTHADMNHSNHMQMMTEYCFNQMDTNNDGVVSMKEYMKYQHKKFQEADTNNDGKLTLEELVAARMKDKEEMKSYMMDHNPQ